jgi:hypothetical protein
LERGDDLIALSFFSVPLIPAQLIAAAGGVCILLATPEIKEIL